MTWSAIAGAIGGTAGSALSSLINYKSASKLMDKQYDINLKTLRNAPSASRQGFVNAGYNPLLALGSGQSGFSASSSGVGADLTSGLEQGINSAIAMKQNKAQINNINADTALKNNQGETEKAKRIQMEFQNAMTDVETHLKQKDLSTYEKRFYSNLYEQMQRAENYRANSAVAQMNAETNRMNANTSAKQAETARLESDRKHPFQTFSKKIYDEDKKGRPKNYRNSPDPWKGSNAFSSESWWFQPIR